MKLGTRIVVATTASVILALGVYGLVSVRIRRAELTIDLERQTHALGATLRISLEAAIQEGLYEDVRGLVARLQREESAVRIAYVELEGAAPPAPSGAPPANAPAAAAGDDEADTEETAYVPPAPDPNRNERIRRVQIEDAAFGEHIDDGGHPVYAYTVPLRAKNKRIVAIIDLVRDESDLEAALFTTIRQVIIAVLAAGLGLALVIWWIARRLISHPLQRLVEGIDEVTVGDLTRVILRERDDEIGDLADRFNQMTTSLREARAETQRGVEARLALETRLHQSEKLATIGQLAANIAHEVGTPLNVIAGRARTLEKKALRAADPAPELPPEAPSMEPGDVAKNAGIIAAQAARITRIIQQLLDYARKKPSIRGSIDISRVLKETVDFLDHQLSQSQVAVRVVPFRAAAGDDVPRAPVVTGDADQLQQVCINLCVNAIQAMPRGGSLELATSGEVRRKPGLDTAPPGRYVVLEVADTGVGIAPEERDKIFEPFYTTKTEGGTGLGLAVAQGIVKDHDGWIEIAAPPEGGTRFRVFLPAADDDAPAPTARERSDSTPAQREDLRSP